MTKPREEFSRRLELFNTVIVYNENIPKEMKYQSSYISWTQPNFVRCTFISTHPTHHLWKCLKQTLFSCNSFNQSGQNRYYRIPSKRIERCWYISTLVCVTDTLFQHLCCPCSELIHTPHQQIIQQHTEQREGWPFVSSYITLLKSLMISLPG